MLQNGGWLTWTIWRAPTNASKWRMGFNSAFKWLINSYKWKDRAVVNRRFAGTNDLPILQNINQKIFLRNFSSCINLPFYKKYNILTFKPFTRRDITVCRTVNPLLSYLNNSRYVNIDSTDSC